MQIPYHKTVAALEWSLEEAVIALLRERRLHMSELDIRDMLDRGIWSEFDDGAMLERIRVAHKDYAHDPVARDHMAAVLHRRPAKLVFSWERLAPGGTTEQSTMEKLLKYKIEESCKDMGIDSRRITIWKAPFKLSKAGPMLQGPSECRDYSDEEAQQLIHVLHNGSNVSVPLIDLPNSVSHHLAKLKYQVLRVYYLCDTAREDASTLELMQRLSDA